MQLQSILLNISLFCIRFSPEIAAKRGLSPAEMAAVEAIHRAVEFNPHVPKVSTVLYIVSLLTMIVHVISLIGFNCPVRRCPVGMSVAVVLFVMPLEQQRSKLPKNYTL